MIRTVILAALALVCLSSVAEARPRGRHFVDATDMVGCADPVMRPCETGGVRVSRRGRAARVGRAEWYRRAENRGGAHGARPRAWCGWWLGRHLGMSSRSLWRALEWRHVGRAAHGPAIGVVVIWSRGKGRGHVGIITGKTERGWVVKSGNDGNAVRERVRSVSTAIAFRWP